MSNKDEIKLLTEQLFNKYGTLLLTPQQTAEVVNRTVNTLRSDREKRCGIPVTKHAPDARASKVYYSITDIAQYLVAHKGL